MYAAAVGAYSLSVLDEDANGMHQVKHYRIRDLEDGGVYISPRLRCTDIVSLIQHYSGLSLGYLLTQFKIKIFIAVQPVK